MLNVYIYMGSYYCKHNGKMSHFLRRRLPPIYPLPTTTPMQSFPFSAVFPFFVRRSGEQKIVICSLFSYLIQQQHLAITNQWRIYIGSENIFK